MENRNLPQIIEGNIRSIALDQEMITPDYFVEHYLEFLSLYIAHGRPSKDTLRHCRSSIDQFIEWCKKNGRHPLSINDYQMHIYLLHIHSMDYKTDTVNGKIVDIRSFFMAAHRMGLIERNPCIGMQGKSSYSVDDMVQYFSVEQITDICKTYKNEPEFIRLRNTLIVFLMGVEGLRSVEVHRSNREDIDWNVGSMYVRGKGHDRRIFPCKQTFRILDLYLQECPKKDRINKAGGILTPLILSDSNNNIAGRITRGGIKYVMNRTLKEAGLKMKGAACHVFRHSCGTNLYAKTKDLRLVQETLGHRDPKTTARYAHLQERISRRATEEIAPDIP